MNKDDKIIRLTELLIYALLPKNIYNHELDMNTFKKTEDIVLNNLQYDTHTIREKIVDCWNNIGKENKNQTNIFDYINEEVLDEKDM